MIPDRIITKSELENSIIIYANLLTAFTNYRQDLLRLTHSTTNLAHSLLESSKSKGIKPQSDLILQTASGLFYVVANSTQLMATTIQQSFEIPLAQAHADYIIAVTARQKEYEAIIRIKTAQVKSTEATNVKSKNRDLISFRRALESLQDQVNQIEAVKTQHYHQVLIGENQIWAQASDKVSLLLRSTLELADRLASKATSDPVFEALMHTHPDPFDAYRMEPPEEDTLIIASPLVQFNSKRKKILSDESWNHIATPLPPISSTPLSVSQVLFSHNPLSPSMTITSKSLPLLIEDRDSPSLSALNLNPTTTSSPSTSSPILHHHLSSTPPSASSIPIHTLSKSDEEEEEEGEGDDSTTTTTNSSPLSKTDSTPPRPPAPFHHLRSTAILGSSIENDSDIDPMRGDWENHQIAGGYHSSLGDEDSS